MKKIFILSVLFCLCACDNNAFVGKCFLNEKTTTTTEQNGKIIKTSNTELFLCGCFDSVESDSPQFMIPKEEFSFKNTNTEKSGELEDLIEYTEDTTFVEYPITDSIADNTTQDATCDKKCTKMCKKR